MNNGEEKSPYWVFVPGGDSDYWRRSPSRHARYDICRKLADGSLLRISEAGSVNEAKQKLQTLASLIPAEYFIREASTGQLIAPDSEDAGDNSQTGAGSSR